MPTEKELLERIRQLEEINSSLQDKLDMIYAILAPEFEEEDPVEEDGQNDDGHGFVQIQGVAPKPKQPN